MVNPLTFGTRIQARIIYSEVVRLLCAYIKVCKCFSSTFTDVHRRACPSSSLGAYRRRATLAGQGWGCSGGPRTAPSPPPCRPQEQQPCGHNNSRWPTTTNKYNQMSDVPKIRKTVVLLAQGWTEQGASTVVSVRGHQERGAEGRPVLQQCDVMRCDERSQYARRAATAPACCAHLSLFPKYINIHILSPKPKKKTLPTGVFFSSGSRCPREGSTKQLQYIENIINLPAGSH